MQNIEVTSYHSITQITDFVVRNGYVWIATPGGVFRYDPQTRQRVFLPLTKRPGDLACGTDGTIWALAGDALYRLDGSTVRLRKGGFGGGAWRSTSLLIGSGKRKAVLTPSTAWSFSEGKWRRGNWRYSYLQRGGTQVNGPVKLEAGGYDSQGRLWVVGNASALFAATPSVDFRILRCDSSGWHELDRLQVWAYQIKALAFGKRDDPWIGTQDAGPSFNGGPLRSGPQGGIWTTTADGLACWYAADGWVKHDLSVTRPKRADQAIVDRDGRKWFRDGNRLYSLHEGEWQRHPVEPAHIALSPTGDLHAACRDDVAKYDESGWKRLNWPASTPGWKPPVTGITFRQDGGPVVYGRYFVSWFEGGEFRFFLSSEARTSHPNHGDFLPDGEYHVCRVDVAPNGTIWIGTDECGLLMYDGKEWQVFNESIGLPSDVNQNFAVGPDNRAWTLSKAGLHVFEGATWRLIPKETLLASLMERQTEIQIHPANADAWLSDCWLDFLTIGPNGGVVVYARTQNTIKRYRNILLIPEQSGWRAVPSPDLYRSDSRYFPFTRLVEFDRHGGLWLASARSGVFHFDGDELYRIDTSNYLAGNNVLALALENERSLWVGTSAGVSHVVLGEPQ